MRDSFARIKSGFGKYPCCLVLNHFSHRQAFCNSFRNALQISLVVYHTREWNGYFLTFRELRHDAEG